MARSALLKAPFQVRFEDRQPGRLAPGELRLKPLVVGICGSDVQYAKRLATDWLRFGHEPVCEVLEVGADIVDLHAGERVVCQTSSACGFCAACMVSRPRDCTNRHRSRFMGYFADEVVVDRRNAFPIGGTPPRSAVLMEPMGVSFDVVRLAEVGLDTDLVIIGPGAIGLMALAIAKRSGARRIFVIGTEADRARFPLCHELGADSCISASEVDAVEAVFELTEGRGVQAVISTATVSTVPLALQMCAFGGRVAFVGESTAEGEEARPDWRKPGPGAVPIDVNWLHLNRLELRGSFAVPNSMLPLGKVMLDDNVLPANRILTHVLPFEHLEEALHIADERTDGAIKVAVEIASE